MLGRLRRKIEDSLLDEDDFDHKGKAVLVEITVNAEDDNDGTTMLVLPDRDRKKLS